MTTPTNPISGFGLTAPHTWITGDRVTTPRLRAAMYNLAALYAQGRPIVYLDNAGLSNSTSITLLTGNSPSINTWAVTLAGTWTWYQVPLSGWYLMQGWIGQYVGALGVATSFYRWGFAYTLGTAQTLLLDSLSSMVGNMNNGSGNDGIGSSCTDLMPLNSATDSVSVWFQTLDTHGSVVGQQVWGAEWVGLPSSQLVSGGTVTVPVGTVVTTPAPASLWPAGPGVTLNGSVAAGGTVLSLPPVPGLRAGQVIGLDWQNSQQAQPYAELATVSSIAGTAVTLAGTTSFAHNASAPVAVPVSAAFLNEQVRDQANFWFYPPMLRALGGTVSQTFTSSTFATVSVFTSGNGIPANEPTIDNFGGLSGSVYTVQVSGIYLCAGSIQVSPLAGNGALEAAIFVGSTTYVGEIWQAGSGSASAGIAVNVRRVLRLTAGQKVSFGFLQSSGGSLTANPSLSSPVQMSRFIMVMRSF